VTSAPFVRTVLTAPQQIASAITASILDGSLRPGDKLPSEEEMASLFGVSRPTVREAVRHLRTQHVLVSSRGRTGGYRVAEFSLETLSAGLGELISLSLVIETLTYGQLFEVRHALDVLAAGLAAARRTDDDLERLRAALPRLGADPAAVAVDDLAFHRVLADCTHNTLISSFSAATTSAFRRFSADLHQAAPELVIAHLDEVVAAVEAGDAQAAQDAMRRHLAYSVEYFGLDDVLTR
jgi:GntR family transcriptional regulator, transcriptional repressor for pyruvate dehydrogenase complex